MSENRDLQQVQRRNFGIAGLRDRSSAFPLVGHVDDLAAAYALGALDSDEIAAVEAHVRGCPACDHAIIDAQRTAGMLSFLAPPQAPPLDSKVALFARVAHAQKAATSASIPMPGLDLYRTLTLPKSSSADDLVMPDRAQSVPAFAVRPKRESRTGWLISVVSAPLLVALIATGFWGLQLRNQLSQQSSQVAELQSELTNFGSGTMSYQLRPGKAAPQAQGEIIMGSDDIGGVVKIDVNTDDGPKSFDLMVNQDGNLVAVAGVTVDQDGIGEARFNLDQPFSEYESIHIQAKPVDGAVDGAGFDTLYQDNSGSLGSTGSGLDIGP